MKLRNKFLGGLALSLLLGMIMPVPSFAVTAADPNAGAVAGIEIAESEEYELLTPDVSIGKDGNILVVWNQEDLAGSDPATDPMSIAFAIYDQAGGLLAGPTEVGQVGRGDYYYRVQMATYNETHDEWLIVWSDYNDHFMQRVDGDGTLIGSTVTMSQFVTLATDRNTQLVEDGDVAPWQSERNGPLQVKWDPTREEYLVTVWDDGSPTINGVAGQRVWANFYDEDLLPVDGNPDLFLIGDPALPANSNGDGMSIALDEANGVWAISFNSSVNQIGQTSKVLTILDRSSGGLTQTHHVMLDSNSAQLPTSLHASFPQVTFIDSSGLFLVTFNAKFDPAVVPGSVATAWQTFGRLVDNTGVLQGTTTAISNIPSLYTNESDPQNPVVDYPDVRNVRPHYDVVNDRLYFTGHVEQQIVDPDFGLDTVFRSYAWSLAGDLADPSDPVPMFAMPDNPTFPGQSARPAIDVRGGKVAMAYMNWPNDDFQAPSQLQLVVQGEYQGTSAAPAGPVPYAGPIVTNSNAVGNQLTLTGSSLDQVTSVSVGNHSCIVRLSSATSITCELPANLDGSFEVTLIGSFGTLSLSNLVRVNTMPAPVELTTWTKNKGGGAVKVYAKHIIGEGKVQIFLNNREIAWVNAADAADPKLRSANGASYLVRTINLVAGQKNVVEIYVDGERTTRAAYTY